MAMRSKDKKRRLVAEQQYQANAVRKIFHAARSVVPNGLQRSRLEQEVHMLLFSALKNQENNMRKAGIEIPVDYVEDTIEAKCSKGSVIAPLYVLCKRCEFCKKQADGTYRCSEFYSGPRREVYIVSDDDGCSRGLLRKEYR